MSMVAASAASTGWFLTNAWLIPALPALGFAIILLFGKRLPGKGAEVGMVSIGAAFVLALGAAVQWIARVNSVNGHGDHALMAAAKSLAPAAGDSAHAANYVEPVISSWTWWQNAGIPLTFGQHIDGLSVMLLVVVTFISLLVQLYSTEYVSGDRRYTHFFAALTLFSAGMLVMVIAESMVQLILGWEIMGLCSFMLIGHWWEEKANSTAALKAFFTVRVGDVGLLVGTAIIFFGAHDWAVQHGSNGFSIQAISGWAMSGTADKTLLFWGAVALFIACIGKSGQFPLHTWLPDAMAGPTPVSSLLHSSTMVVAGVFLVARVYPVFWTGFDIATPGFNLIAVIGAITIVTAAALAFVQNDIKKVLAYSTVSQLGYMMLGLGVGAWLPAVFHIFTHAFFKCCLFLAAGSISHSGSHHSFDMKRDMGGLRKHMPITFWTWMVSTLALCGVPLFSGFFSKDEIIDNAGNNGYQLFYYVGLIGAAMTAAYMTRATYLTFFGTPRGAAAGSHGEPHESPFKITAPLIVLAVLAVGSGYLNAPAFGTHFFTDWVEPVAAAEGTSYAPKLTHAVFSWAKAAPSIILVAVGGLVSWWLCLGVYGGRRNPMVGFTERSQPAGFIHTLLVNKYYLDDLYEKVIVRLVTDPIAKGAYWFNQNIIDRIVNGVGAGGKAIGGWLYNTVDQGVVDGAVKFSGTIAEETGRVARPLQSGKVNLYGALLFGAATVGGIVLILLNA